MSKSDSSEYKKRVNIIYAMILQGYQRKKIIQYISKKFDVSDRQIDNYIKDARKIMSEEQDVDVGLKKSEILSQLYDLYDKNLYIEDYRECRNILAQISTIVGANAPVLTESKVTQLISLGNGVNPK